MAAGSGSERSKPCLYRPVKEVPTSASCRPHQIPGGELPDGGYSEEFVQAVDNKYRCEHCQRVLRNAKQTECGHRFCESCLNALLRVPGQVCPADQQPLDNTEVFNDNCCRKEILKLLIHCRNRKAGCQQQTALGSLEAHLNSCPFQTIQCSRCPEMVQRQELSDHLMFKCKHKAVQCRHCQKEMTVAELKAHEESECLSSLVASPKPCGARGHRTELKGPMSEYLKAEGCCKFSSYGCTFKGTSQRTKEHETQSVEQHLLLVLLRNKALEEKVSELESEIIEKHSVLQKLAGQIPKMEKEMSLTNQSVNRSEIKLNQSQNIRIIMNYPWLLISESVEQQVAQHDNLLSVHEVRLAEIDLRFQLLETASYNGRLIWKIRDYARRKQEAVSGKTLSLYSQPFYSSSFGYKMCARVYLNGDGMGKGTHLSLFFVVMRGEYDPLLPWPFKQKVTLTLLDQGLAKAHVSDTFKPDPNSSSFRRPQSEMNVASGCPLFVTQTVLENEMHHYIKDDTIFIKVTVDVSDFLEL
ncbi:TNF receptor-associated factor 3-like [Chiloscyllium plagiosum]|uniref:TNF receptor-associated factor 3-like n=1 Tax=Chiloscyllium plagiosum TaxID=36176 RepID=UPI001CB81FC7|nr:TNF receptor-associated factor 3-like [Chiloscyllium plagiosum]